MLETWNALWSSCVDKLISTSEGMRSESGCENLVLMGFAERNDQKPMLGK